MTDSGVLIQKSLNRSKVLGESQLDFRRVHWVNVLSSLRMTLSILDRKKSPQLPKPTEKLFIRNVPGKKQHQYTLCPYIVVLTRL